MDGALTNGSRQKELTKQRRNDDMIDDCVPKDHCMHDADACL